MSDLRDKIAGALNIAGAQCGWCSREPGEPLSECGSCYEVMNRYADAVLAVIDLDKVRAEAVHEAALYVERITPKGLVDRADVIADLTIAADRLESGIHANGRERKAEQ